MCFNLSRAVNTQQCIACATKMKICKCSKKVKRKNKDKEGYGLIDYIVNKLPEIHIPGYQYCGPGTDLEKRLARGDPGVNKLDQACKDHDIAYSKVKNSKDRREADRALIARALPRIYSPNAKLGERAAALLTTGAMGTKLALSKIGLGLNGITKSRRRNIRKKTKGNRRRKALKQRKSNKKKRSKMIRKSISFGKLVRGAGAKIKKSKLKPLSLNGSIKAAIQSVKKMKRNKSVKLSRILKLPKFGGSVIPIVPIVSALSAVGLIPSSTAAIVKAIKEIQNATKQFSENNSIGETQKKIGRGLYLMRNPSGSGFYLKPFQKR